MDLICPGYAKSGTTLLYFALGQTAGFATPKAGKESAPFASKDPDLGLHFDGGSEGVRLDISPTYLNARTRTERKRIADVIASNSGEEYQVLLAIRNPITRAFSLYVHQIQAFARFGTDRYSAETRSFVSPYAQRFEDAVAADSRLHMDLSATVPAYASRLGVGRFHSFFLERDVSDFSSFSDRLRDALGMDPDHRWQDSELPRVLEQRRLPTIFAGAVEPEIEVDGVVFRIPPDSVYIASDIQHELVRNVDGLSQQAMLNGQAMWTSSISGGELSALYRRFYREDTERGLEALVNCGHDVVDYEDVSLRDREIERVPASVEFLSSNDDVVAL